MRIRLSGPRSAAPRGLFVRSAAPRGLSVRSVYTRCAGRPTCICPFPRFPLSLIKQFDHTWFPSHGLWVVHPQTVSGKKKKKTVTGVIIQVVKTFERKRSQLFIRRLVGSPSCWQEIGSGRPRVVAYMDAAGQDVEERWIRSPGQVAKEYIWMYFTLAA